MKKTTLWALCLGVGVFVAEAGSEHLVKQRAKDLRDQNNERQGVTTSPPPGTSTTQPQPSAAPVVVPYTPQPSAPSLSTQAKRISDSLEKIGSSASPTDDDKQQLTDSLAAASTGSVKPSGSKISRLSRDLSIALAGKELSSSKRGELAGQIERALNESLNASQMESLSSAMTDLLRGCGVGKVDATVVSNDIKSIVAERQKNSGK